MVNARPEPLAAIASPSIFGASTPLMRVGLSGLDTLTVAKPPVVPLPARYRRFDFRQRVFPRLRAALTNLVKPCSDCRDQGARPGPSPASKSQRAVWWP